MAMSDYGRKNISETCFRTITHPVTNLISVVVAVLIAALASVPTGIPAYVLAPIAFMLMVIVDPTELIARTRARHTDDARMPRRAKSLAGGWQAKGKGWRLKFTSQLRHTKRNQSAERRQCKR